MSTAADDHQGLVDMSTLKGEDVNVGEEEAGKGYGNKDSDMSRGSQNTKMYQNRICGRKEDGGPE